MQVSEGYIDCGACCMLVDQLVIPDFKGFTDDVCWCSLSLTRTRGSSDLVKSTHSTLV
jgi:hypothetical protein